MGINQHLIGALLTGMSFLAPPANAQTIPPTETEKVVLFLPLYLDSIFDEKQEFKYNKGEFPRFVGGPLEFYQGFEQALDSLKKRKGNIDVIVVDTRANNLSLPTLLEKDSISKAKAWLLLGNAVESRQLAELAKAFQVPLFNINLPNDAGIQENPYYFMCNTTLKTQCESIYQFLQKNYPLYRILFVRKKGNMEDKILNYWQQLGEETAGVPITYSLIETSDTITSKELNMGLDTFQKVLLVGASLEERFARNLATAATEMKKSGYKIELMGMSTWDIVREFNTNRYRNVEITIPTPFHYPKTDALSKWLQIRFQDQNYGKISDPYVRGYELAWFLHPYLQSSSPPLSSFLPGKRKLLFAEIDWQPAMNQALGQIDYYENKKLYFVKRVDGLIRSVR
ncbi:MAG: hypothetical protein FJX92_04530 [Bacteroidetes bacterium]|nr:hypothetical protein [Bacteroidota bacterium]